MKSAAFFLLIALLVIAILPAAHAFYPRFFRAPVKPSAGVAEKPTAPTKTPPGELKKGAGKKQDAEDKEDKEKKCSPFGALKSSFVKMLRQPSDAGLEDQEKGEELDRWMSRLW
ncbi:hypothetical protein T484DRAFT_1879444 [Baffinella frigidus]|nr:hypothetical protein T484DRAFT_1879444 [Cryptophyta sp. CCMP2293]